LELRATDGTGTLFDRVERFERDAILAALQQSAYRMSDAARALGLERSHLYKKCQQLGIDLRSERKSD
jgi:DNA-binding NtrC family response regulator